MQFNLWSACRCPEPNAPHILVGTLHDSHCHQYINVCMNYCKLLWTKVSNKWQKCKDDIMMLLFQRPSDPFISVSLLWAHTDVVHGYFCERCEYSLCIWSEHMHICSVIITKISYVLESSEGKSPWESQASVFLFNQGLATISTIGHYCASVRSPSSNHYLN